MKGTFKLIAGIFVTVAVIGGITLLAVKYFDVLMKILGDFKSQLSGNRPRFLSDACCDCCDDGEEELEF